MFTGVDYALMEIEGWARGLSDGCVAIETARDRKRNSYGAAAVMTLTPRAPDTCLMEISIIDEAPLRIGLCLDNQSRVGNRLKVDYTASRKRPEGRAALHLEPRPIERDRLLRMCDTVARGEIRLKVGVFGWKLGAGRGALLLPGETVRMHGFGAPLWLYRTFRAIGLARVHRIIYQPWC